MPRTLIINADDLGHPFGTVEAILDLFQLGAVTSTSAMVNQPFWPQAADMLRHHPEWDAGVHLVMNGGRPILGPHAVPSLVDRAGDFYNGLALLVRYPLISRRQLAAEWRAQVDKFVVDTGRAPSHIDLHCHFPYVFPAWFRISLELAQAYGNIAVRTPFDDALEFKTKALSASYGGFPPWFILYQGRRYRRMVDGRNLPRTQYWESSFSQDGGRTTEHLLQLLEALPEGTTELLSHPGTEGWRLEDYQSLRDPRVRERIEELDIRLIGYGDLSGA